MATVSKAAGEDHVDRGAYRHPLMDSENAARDVGRIDSQLHGSGIRNIAGRRDRVDDRNRLRRAVGGANALRGEGEGGNGEERDGAEMEAHGRWLALSPRLR